MACLNETSDVDANLFYEFQSLDYQARAFQTTPTAVIRLGKKDIKLSKQDGEDWKSYARTTQMDNDQWVTVQSLRLAPTGFFSGGVRYAFKVFDENGKKIDDQTLITGAMRAVTGRTFSGPGIEQTQEAPPDSAPPSPPSPITMPPISTENWNPFIGKAMKIEVRRACREEGASKLQACVDGVVAKMIESVKAVCASGAVQDGMILDDCGKKLLNAPWSDVTTLPAHISDAIVKDHLLKATNGSMHQRMTTFIEWEAKSHK